VEFIAVSSAYSARRLRVKKKKNNVTIEEDLDLAGLTA
jgi:hypothetical protein